MFGAHNEFIIMLSISDLDFTTNIETFVTFNRLRMQITNFTAMSTMSRFKVYTRTDVYTKSEQ